MATFNKPDQNFSFDFPDEGQIFKFDGGGGGTGLLIRQGNQIFDTNLQNLAAQFIRSQSPGVDFNSASNPGQSTTAMNAIFQRELGRSFGKSPASGLIPLANKLLADRGIDINSLSTLSGGNLADLKGNLGQIGLTQGSGSNINFDSLGTTISNQPTTPSGEVITSTIDPNNPHAAINTSNLTGQVGPQAPSTAEQAANFGLTAEQLAPTQPSPDIAQGGVGAGVPTTNAGGPTGSEVLGQTYTVQAGDTLNAIASQFGFNNYKDANISGFASGNPDLIHPGEVLNIGGAGQTNSQGGVGDSPVDAGSISGDPQVPDTGNAGFDFAAQGQQIINNLNDQYNAGLSMPDPNANPMTSWTQMIQDVMSATGLPSSQSQIKQYTDQIESLANERDDKVAVVNDNPWISESERNKQAVKIAKRYEAKEANLVNKLKLWQEVEAQARQDAQWAAGVAINMFQADRQFLLSQQQLALSAAESQASLAFDQLKLQQSASQFSQGFAFDKASKAQQADQFGQTLQLSYLELFESYKENGGTDSYSNWLNNPSFETGTGGGSVFNVNGVSYDLKTVQGVKDLHNLGYSYGEIFAVQVEDAKINEGPAKKLLADAGVQEEVPVDANKVQAIITAFNKAIKDGSHTRASLQTIVDTGRISNKGQILILTPAQITTVQEGIRSFWQSKIPGGR